MTDTTNALLAALWRASWQGALVIAIVAVVCRAAERRLSPALRCALWRLTYAKLMLGLAVAGGVALPLLRPATQAITAAAPAPSTIATLAVPHAESTPFVTLPFAEAAPSISPAQATAPPLRWQTLLAVAYAAGLLVCLTRLARALWRTSALLRSAAPLRENGGSGDAAKVAVLRALAASMGLRRVACLASSATLTSPAYVAGTVLLPAHADYAPSDLRLILAHELAHARRRDLSWEWLGVAAQTLFFFHPLVHVARREECLARESAADALALAATDAPAADLGKLLLDLARRPSVVPPLAAAIGVVEGGLLLRRRLLALKKGSPMQTRRVAVPLLFGFFLLLIPVQMTTAARNAGKKDAPAKVEKVESLTIYRNMGFGRGTITGQVRDESGKPLPQMYLSLTDDNPKPEPQKKGQTLTVVVRSYTVCTDDRGRYVLEHVPFSHYRLHFKGKSTRATNAYSPAAHRFAPIRKEVDLSAVATTKSVDFTALPGSVLYGRVLDRATGAPVARAVVSGFVDHRVNDISEAGLGEDDARTDATGRYFLRFQPGVQGVAANVLLDDGTSPTSMFRTKFFRLSAGQSATADVYVSTKKPVPSRADFIGFVLSGETGKPMANIAVRVEPEVRGADGNFPSYLADTDARGEFDMIQMPLGRYTVSVDDDARTAETFIELTASDAPKKVTLSYIRPATISGKFTKANGKPNVGIAMMGWMLDHPSDSQTGWTFGNSSKPQNVTICYTGWEDGRYKMQIKAGDIFIGPYSGGLVEGGSGKKFYIIKNAKKLHLAPGQAATLDFDQSQTTMDYYVPYTDKASH